MGAARLEPQRQEHQRAVRKLFVSYYFCFLVNAARIVWAISFVPGGVGMGFAWKHFGVVAEGLVELDDGLARFLFEMGDE